MGLNLECPRCGKLMTFDVASARVHCKHCGYAPMDDANALREAEPPRRERPRDLTAVGVTSRHKPSARQKGLFYDGMMALHRGEREKAAQYFERAVEMDKAFTDPWLWLASTTDDPKQQREYLEWVLAYEPDHLEALKAIGLLDGRLKREDLDPNAQQKKFAIRRLADEEPATAEADKVNCPQCGGKLSYDVVQRLVICWHCNYQEDIEDASSGADQSMLVDALLKRKYKPHRWQGAERILTCDNCGASVTLSSRTMTDQCAFCSSRNVLVSDNVGSFEQPDAIIPFRGTEELAVETVLKKMNSGVRALTRFFRSDISHHEAHAVYLPFWVYDAMVQVKWSYPGTPEHGEDADYMTDVLTSGTDSIERALLRKLEPYELNEAQKYDPRFLADWPAEIYQLDVDEASLQARQQMSELAKRRVTMRRPSTKRTRTQFGQEKEVPLQVGVGAISGMMYRLALLPVWIVLLHEENDKIRRCLVNGQTGKVVIGGRLGGLL